MRTLIELNLNTEDKSERAIADQELNKAFSLISERAQKGTQDAEDIAFAKSRRAYLSDVSLELITGMTFDEIEAEASGEKELTVAELKAELTAKGIEFDPKAKKPELKALLDKATA